MKTTLTILTILIICAFSFSCAYTPARAYRLTETEQHEAKHEFLERKVKSLQEEVYELRNRLDELEKQKMIMIPEEPIDYSNIKVIAEDVTGWATAWIEAGMIENPTNWADGWE